MTTRSSTLKPKNIDETISIIAEWHLNVRAFQMSKINDPIWGITSPFGAFNMDEVPLTLCPSYEGIGENIDT